MDSSFRIGAWIKLHLIFKASGLSGAGSWSFKCWAYLKNQPHCVTSWTPEISNHNWWLGRWKVWSECTQLHRQGSVSWILFPTEKGMLYNTFQTQQNRSHQLQICFENSQHPWGASAASFGDRNPFSSYFWQPYRGSFYHNSQNLCCTSYFGSLEHNKS